MLLGNLSLLFQVGGTLMGEWSCFWNHRYSIMFYILFPGYLSFVRGQIVCLELSSLSLFDRPKDGFLGEKMYWESIVLDIAFQRKAPLGSEASRSRLP